jgi:4-hydroxybenzoate polyprenyltransferase
MQESHVPGNDRIAPAQAQEALAAVARARQRIADEVGLPRGYWWGLAAGWVVLGVIGEFGPSWLVTAATVLFGVGHSTLASRLLDGRRRSDGVRVSSAVAGHRTAYVVVGMLVLLVALTVAAALLFDADGAGHPTVWAAVLVAAIVGLGGPEILRTLRRWVRA